MTKKRKTGLAISVATACIAVLCAAGACNGIRKEEKAVRRVIVTSATLTSKTTEPINTTTTLPTTTAPVTTTAETTAGTTTAPQITTAVTCSATEQGLDETPTPTMTIEQTTEADTTVQLTTTQMATTAAPAVTTAPPPTEPYNGQTSGDYIYCIGFGWIFNEGGGGEGSVNYEMYCNGNKIGYFG